MQSTDRLDQFMRNDPRWADPEFRRHVRELDRRLREEERTMNQIRRATRGLIGLMWKFAGDREREKTVAAGHGHLDSEWNAALASLDEDGLRHLRAACHAALDYLRGEREQADGDTEEA